MESELEGMGRKGKCGEVIRCGQVMGSGWKELEGIGRNRMKWKEWKGMGSEGKKWEGIRWNEKNGK